MTPRQDSCSKRKIVKISHGTLNAAAMNASKGPAKRKQGPKTQSRPPKNAKGTFAPAGFPMELLEPPMVNTLVRECDQDHVIQSRVEAQLLQKREWGSLQEFLTACQLSETETLNNFATSGSCQFSSLGDQLWGKACTEEFRPDLQLRRVALEMVRIWHENFVDYFLVADGTTRRQQARGGRTVDVDDFLVRMSYLNCDGDHITLQVQLRPAGRTY